jgi:hypothetical protein
MESTGNWTSVRPGSGPTPVDSPGSQNIATAPGGATAAIHGVPAELLQTVTTRATIAIVTAVVALAIVLLYTAQLHFELQREKRLQTQAIDERRMEARYIARAIGIQGSDIQDHDITTILAQLEKKRVSQP